MPFIDIGANLAHDSFDPDREAVIARALNAGIEQIIVTGSCAESSTLALQLAQSHPNQLFATAGLHPHHAKDFKPELIEIFRELATHPELVAIGETGLDFFRNFSPAEDQEKAFIAHLELAATLNKPLFLHQRDAHQRFLPIIREHREHLGKTVVHCFTGSEEELEDYLALDLHIGLTGWICDERRGHHMHAYLNKIPLNRLMLETDAPYLMPRNLHPKPKTRRNEPYRLPAIAEMIATVFDQPQSVIETVTTETARDFFELPQPRQMMGNLTITHK